MHSEEAHARPAGDPQTRPNGEPAPPANGGLLGSEDWWAIWLGGFILLAAALATYLNRPADYPERLAELERRRQHLAELESRARAAGEPAEREQLRGEVRQERDALKEARSGLADNPFAAWFAKPGSWDDNPLDAFFKSGKSLLPGILGAFLVGLLLFGAGVRVMGGSFARFAPAFLGVFLLAVLAYVLAGQKVIKHYNLEYALWALLVGLLISNTVGTPASLRPAVRTEFYIKTGLVLLGADVLFGKPLALGVPGIFVSWVVTPIVLVGTYLFGQRVLKIRSRSLNM
ncbi:MAG TPA: putative sulfate exporter family transporter, partial [Gemmataceae bacterium]